jgi:hypothetical protein
MQCLGSWRRLGGPYKGLEFWVNATFHLIQGLSRGRNVNSSEWERIILHSLNSFSSAVSPVHAFDSPRPHGFPHIFLAGLESQSAC